MERGLQYTHAIWHYNKATRVSNENCLIFSIDN
jgi:hypothetical protein